MSAKLEFFYDYVSTYSYLANSQLDGFADAEIVYRPMFLGAVMDATGNRPPGMVAAKGRYMGQDLMRWVERYDLPFEMNPVFPQNTLKALRLSMVAMDSGVFDVVHKALFAAMWTEERDLSDLAVIAEIAEGAGIPADAIENPDIKARLKANTEEAVSRGVFGAPTFFVGEKMFFGNDRFDFIREALAGG